MTKLVGIGMLLIAAILLAACTASATPAAQPAVPTVPAATSTLAPATLPAQPAGQTPSPIAIAVPTGIGASLKKGSVIIDSQAVAYDAAKKQAVLNLSGGLPTPCHKLQTDVAQPSADNHIDVSVYSLVNPSTICAQVIKPFEASVPLGSVASGTYTVYVNNAKVGDVKVP